MSVRMDDFERERFRQRGISAQDFISPRTVAETEAHARGDMENSLAAEARGDFVAAIGSNRASDVMSREAHRQREMLHEVGMGRVDEGEAARNAQALTMHDFQGRRSGMDGQSRISGVHMRDLSSDDGQVGAAGRLRLSLGLGPRQRVREYEGREMRMADMSSQRAETRMRESEETDRERIRMQGQVGAAEAAAGGVRAQAEAAAARERMAAERPVVAGDRVIDPVTGQEIAPRGPQPIVAGNRVIDPVTGQEIAPPERPAGPDFQGELITRDGQQMYWDGRTYVPVRGSGIDVNTYLTLQFTDPEAAKLFIAGEIEAARQRRGGGAPGAPGAGAEGTRVRVRRPDGTLGSVPEHQLEEARAQGYVPVGR